MRDKGYMKIITLNAVTKLLTKYKHEKTLSFQRTNLFYSNCCIKIQY